ncbi:carbohydrate ABC transporter permease [Treponema brennaborense]|uniref:ABC-type transporter, integral membrane subunit n=1 Tax=Treponema brennaborense (strain DSM 12168 / CIP 105900 / DD5/3) TaxID=906968 RepID=F4LNV6_TREBD|nr:sugar ABC transporter permease [Treponema brennaborense]AEE17933.1 ABC-type transporter, integral membrane subunit [Treponema brennaborense DSM 12168]
MKNRKSRLTYEQKKARWGWFFTLPGLLFFALFSFYPIINAFITSLYNKKLLSLKAPAFVGVSNYAKILSSPDFWNSMRATAVFTVGCFIPLVIVSLVLAVFITSRSKFKRGFQMILYSPAVLSSVVAALIWMLLFDPRGVMNQFMNTLTGQNGVDYKWLADSVMVQFSTIMVYFWKYVGYFTILYITGIGKIPDTVYEAATIDGASAWQRFLWVTMPLLKPTTVMVSIMAMIQCLKTFSTQYLFTQSGAPLAPINVITLNIYNTAMRDLAISRASVMSIILFLIMLLLTTLQMKVTKSDDVTF